MARPETFTTAEVAAMLGASKSYVVDRINAGDLPAVRLKVGERGRVFYRVPRDAVVRFLVASGFPLDGLRRLLNPDGAVLLCRTGPAVQAELGRLFRTVAVDGLFALGRALETVPAWAAVVNLPEVGTAEACHSVRPYYLSPDRVELVGLTGPDGVPAALVPSPTPFDLLIPNEVTPAAVARAVGLLRGRG